MSHLSQAVLVKRASELLHSMAASKDLLFWTPRGQLLRSKRIIPVTNIAELLEYVLLPHNDDVTKPRALNTFLDGLAEFGIDKGLNKNKRLLRYLVEKEKGFVLYAITRSPRREITSKRAFFGVTIVEQLHTKTPRRWKPIFIPLLNRRTKKRINFHSFQIAVYLTLFVTGFQ